MKMSLPLDSIFCVCTAQIFYLNLLKKCVTVTVQGADPGTVRNAGAVHAAVITAVYADEQSSQWHSVMTDR